ncbi:TPA: nucleotidyl transferase AbiEii/AbiGii toxin family protein [Candidatus Woesearchaeota archaeon]|nr:nucleotidyl transferase AbiEii/AbiGii toxin family protein [Candidatus Woesearchaeota archaeon]
MKKLIEYISTETKIENKTLIEKDIIIHQMLTALSKNNYFYNNFAFKGGTCLTKCYYGYYRFSEDLDFSWIKQQEFTNKSQKKIRKLLSKKIDNILRIIKEISDTLNMDFQESKSDKRYIELGGSNRFTTIKTWYKSATTGNEQFIKIQINFVEKFYYPFQKHNAKSLIEHIKEKEFTFLFPEYKTLLHNTNIITYDIREILLEKCRAAITRRGTKTRDYIDIYIITHKEKIDIAKYKKQIIDKTRFMLKYNKYIQNLNQYHTEKIILGEEEKLLLKPLPKEFQKTTKKIIAFLNNICKEIKNQ